jgi:DNA mismatch repair protein MutS
MVFGIDKQTERDLNIFPQTIGDFSVLDYYNLTATKGGRVELESMMRTPSNCPLEIEYRISAIKFIHNNSLRFNLDRRGLHSVDLYLSLNVPILSNNLIYSIGAWIDYQLNKNNHYYLISKGVECLRMHLKTLSILSEKVNQSDAPPFFKELIKEVEEMRSMPGFTKLLEASHTGIHFRQLSRYDTLLRGQEKARISNLMRLTYLLDAFISLAETAKTKKLAFPVLTNSPKPYINIKGIFHPFFENPVLNDVALNDNSNLCFVSGANMAGKSSFLKSVGLCVYLAHIGFPVPASAMEASVFSGLYSTINLSDDIAQGYSHYYSEVKRVKEIALMIKDKKRVFVIFDELFRGTNVKDAYDATLMITSGFTKLKNSLFFVSTHIVEVCQELEKLNAITFKQLDSKLENGKPIYSYKLKNGISSDRLGLTIVKNEKIMEIIEEIAQNEDIHYNHSLQKNL